MCEQNLHGYFSVIGYFWKNSPTRKNLKKKIQLGTNILILIISGCCDRNYNENDFEFKTEELKHFSNYKIGDTLFFKSNLGDIDTITIVSYEKEIHQECGMIAPRPVNSKWVEIKHLPIDRWHGTSQEAPDWKTQVVYQGLFWISKYPREKEIEYTLDFKDFFHNDSIIGEFQTDTVSINNFMFSDYYIVRHSYPDRVTEAKNIEILYWTDKYGLTAYKSKNGEIWSKKSSR